MSDYKEIQLTEDDAEGLREYAQSLIDDAAADMQEGGNCRPPKWAIDVINQIPPKRKVIKLKDLPEGTLMKVTYNNGASRTDGLVGTGKTWGARNANGAFIHELTEKISVELLQGPKTVWEGGECPVPDGVEVRCSYIENAFCIVDTTTTRFKSMVDNIMASDRLLLWYQITGNLADGYVVEG